MTADLLSRLRERAHLPEYRFCDTAADEIQNLRAECYRMTRRIRELTIDRDHLVETVEQLRKLASNRDAREAVAHEILSNEESDR